jgi:Domain of unknown function (DUF4129)
MTDNARRNSLILLGLVMILIMIIASSLPQLELQPGVPPPRLENNQVVISPAEAGPIVAITINKIILAFVILLAAGSLLRVLYKSFRGADLKNIVTFILQMLVIGLVLTGFLILILMLLPKSEGPVLMEQTLPPPEPPVGSPLGPVPPVLFWLVGISLLVAGILMGIWIFDPASRRTTTIEAVGLEAEKAWRELKIGLGLKGVIIKCYRQMSLALEKEQGIERKECMTTGEFENLLEAAGVPRDPIHQLTRLFEAVRYGNWQPGPLDEQNAIYCLEAIMVYSRKAKKAS